MEVLALLGLCTLLWPFFNKSVPLAPLPFWKMEGTSPRFLWLPPPWIRSFSSSVIFCSVREMLEQFVTTSQKAAAWLCATSFLVIGLWWCMLTIAVRGGPCGHAGVYVEWTAPTGRCQSYPCRCHATAVTGSSNISRRRRHAVFSPQFPVQHVLVRGSGRDVISSTDRPCAAILHRNLHVLLFAFTSRLRLQIQNESYAVFAMQRNSLSRTAQRMCAVNDKRFGFHCRRPGSVWPSRYVDGLYQWRIEGVECDKAGASMSIDRWPPKLVRPNRNIVRV